MCIVIYLINWIVEYIRISLSCHIKFLIRRPLHILSTQKGRGIGLVHYQHLSMNAYVGSLKLHIEEHLIFSQYKNIRKLEILDIYIH